MIKVLERKKLQLKPNDRDVTTFHAEKDTMFSLWSRVSRSQKRVFQLCVITLWCWTPFPAPQLTVQQRLLTPVPICWVVTAIFVRRLSVLPTTSPIKKTWVLLKLTQAL